MAPLSAVVLLLASVASAADGVADRLDAAATVSQAAANAADPAAAREGASVALDGGRASDAAVDAAGGVRKIAPLAKPTLHASVSDKAAPPAPSTDDKRSGPSKVLVMGGAAVLGGMQGWFSAGLIGAAAGAGLGLAAAWLFEKKDYGAAFGVTAGAILGTAFGGPLGSAIGAAVGGLVGHFLGKLFL